LSCSGESARTVAAPAARRLVERYGHSVTVSGTGFMLAGLLLTWVATMATGDAGRGNPSRAEAGTRGRRNSGGEVDRDEDFDAVEDLLMAVDANPPAGTEKSR
jgi:hypothetical protein